jgi:hypothetical protein
MAIWQFDAHLIPDMSVGTHYGALPLVVTRQEFDGHNWWADISPDDLVADLKALLPSCPSWHPDISMRGSEDGNRIDLLTEQGHLRDIFIRIDVRNLSYSLLGQLCCVCQEHACHLLIDGGQLIRPSVRRVLAAIEISKAFAFVTDPEEFLRQLGHRDNDSGM